jgi:hypothetical protein
MKRGECQRGKPGYVFTTMLALVTIGVSCLVSCRPQANPTAVLTPPASPTATSTSTATPSPLPADTPISVATPTPVPTDTPTTTTPPSVPTDTPTPTMIPTLVLTDTPIPTPVATLNPAGHVGLGAHLEGTPYDRFAAIQQFEGLLRHKMQYVLWFQAWGNDDRGFPDYWIELASQNGLVPVITWEPWKRNFDDPAAPQPEYSLDSIAAGEHDEYIRSWARGAQSMGVPIILRFAHEQSTEPGVRLWYPWQGNPQGYKAAYGHIVTLFREEGARNVQFLWSAMWLDQWASEYYPGDDVVDYGGTTVLNHGTAPTVPWAEWRTFDELFGEQYQAALQWGKPIIVTELATAEQGGDKAAWLRDCFTSLQSRYPLVQGVLLLEAQSDREWPSINWSVASSEESLAAFREAIDDPYFK